MPLYREDYAAYGPELIDLTQRAARESVGPELEQLRRQQADIAAREQRIQSQMIFDKLTAAIPNWRQINSDPRFYVDFLGAQEEFSGRPAIELLREGFAQGDFRRVKAFFDAYLQVTGQAPAPQAPTARQQSPARQVTGRREDLIKQMTTLLQQKMRGAWRGREKEAEKLEADLHRAIHS